MAAGKVRDLALISQQQSVPSSPSRNICRCRGISSKLSCTLRLRNAGNAVHIDITADTRFVRIVYQLRERLRW
jgi:hypothetical protein